MISLQNVSKSYGHGRQRQVVLSPLSALFDGADDVGILGGNGSGKSTLLRLMAGMERPDSGRVVRSARISVPIGFAGYLHPDMSGHDNVRFLARMYRLDVAAMVRYVREFAEIGPYFDRPMHTYSNSMRARLSYAASIAVDADIYLVDETTAVGDAEFKRKCHEAFAARRRTAKIIMVSQAATTIMKICNRGAVLEGGHLRLFRSMPEAAAEYLKLQVLRDVAHQA